VAGGGYAELISCPARLSSEEQKKLGYETALHLYKRWEEFFQWALSWYGYDDSCMFNGLEAGVHDVFQSELAEVKFDGDVFSGVKAKARGGLEVLLVAPRFDW
jgi:hypothetical protein